MRVPRGREDSEKSRFIPSLMYGERDPSEPSPPPAHLPIVSRSEAGYVSWDTQQPSGQHHALPESGVGVETKRQQGMRNDWSGKVYEMAVDKSIANVLAKSHADLRRSMEDGSLTSVVVRHTPSLPSLRSVARDDGFHALRPPSHVHWEEKDDVTEEVENQPYANSAEWQHNRTASLSSFYSRRSISNASLRRGNIEASLAPSGRASRASEYAVTSLSHNSQAHLLPPSHTQKQVYSEVPLSHVDVLSKEFLTPITGSAYLVPPPLLTLSVVSSGYPMPARPHHRDGSDGSAHHKKDRRTSALHAAANGLEPIPQKQIWIPGWAYVVGTIMGSAMALATIILSVEVH